ncbi:MAG: flagellar protein FlgN [Geobacter sp.]
MTAAVTNLVVVLQEQLAVFTDLRQLLQEEQQAIMAVDTARMEQLNSLKEPVVMRQFKTADALRDAIGVLARQLGSTPVKSVSELLPKLPREAAAELAPLQRKVQESGVAVNELARQNRGMLERFLGTVNDSLGFLLRVLNTSNQYGAAGTYIQRTQSGAVMVNREA